MPVEDEARRMVYELLDLEEGLTEREVKFIEDISKRLDDSVYRLTGTQLLKLDQIYEQRVR